MDLEHTGMPVGWATRRRIIGVALLAIASTIGCTGGAPGASAPPTASAPTAQVASPAPATSSPRPTATAKPSISAAPTSAVKMPAAIQGKWTADVYGTTASSGGWKLEITAGNLFLTNPIPGADPFSLDPKSVTDSQIVFPSDTECPDQGTPTVGTYSYRLDGDKLTIKLVSDSCGDRASVLDKTAWTRAT